MILVFRQLCSTLFWFLFIQTLYFDILVPTVDTVRYGFLMQKLLSVRHSVLFTGTTGVGKVRNLTQLSLSFTQSLTHSRTHPRTHPLPHSFTLTHPFTQPLACSLTHSLARSLTLSLSLSQPRDSSTSCRTLATTYQSWSISHGRKTHQIRTAQAESHELGHVQIIAMCLPGGAPERPFEPSRVKM